MTLVVATAFAWLASCGTSTDDGARSSTSTTSSVAAATTPSSTAPATTAPRTPTRITINFAGDINFEPPRAELLRTNPGAILGAITPVLRDADLTVVNLETAVTERGTPETKAFTFRTSPAALDVLRGAGVDVASIANNHGLDYGPLGVPDALAASRDEDFPLIGIGENESQALTPYRTTIHGNRVGVIAATQVLDDNLIPSWTATEDHPGLASAKRVDSLLAAVRALRSKVDTLVVFLHWGIETHTCPSEAQTTLAHQLADAGADIIVGGHAHRVQGAGRLDHAIVNYGLGNFAFYAGSPEAATTGVFRVTTGGGKPAVYEWIPARIDGNGSPIPLDGTDARTALAAWDAQRSCTGLTP